LESVLRWKFKKKIFWITWKGCKFIYIYAQEIREILAELGFRKLTDIIGRSDLLKQINKGSSSLDDLDLSPLFIQADSGDNKRYCDNPIINKVPDTLDQKI
jgi:glutamate synthase (NADPH/NADH) large chain